MAGDPESTIAEFLSSINPNFEKYGEKLNDAGMTSVDELSSCAEDDFKHLDIPMFHWRTILKKVKDLQEGAGEESLSPTSSLHLKAPVHHARGYSKADSNPSSTPQAQSSIRLRLIQFYSLYAPEKVDDDEQIDAILKQYAGNVTQLFQDLERQYVIRQRPSPEPKKKGKKGGKKKENKAKGTEVQTKTQKVSQGLSEMYINQLKGLEQAFQFPKFHSPLLNQVDFEVKPLVMLVGQYSVGKTSFIRFLLERDFPGIRVGPEPTTDCFACVMHGGEERLIPGNAAVMDPTKPFRTLQQFGMGFMNKFNVAEVPAPILESISFVDTPGILSGEKQRIGRQYDFSKIIEWFAFKADRILLLFDAHKLDISDEFKMAIDCIKIHNDKVRVVLNKADTITNQQMIRVYGALMWSLGKVFKTPEVLRVYVGSFWDEPYKNTHNADLFDAEAEDLLSDLRSLPRHSATRKINEFVKRARQLKVHLMIISHLKKQFGWFGKQKKENALLASLGDQFRQIAKAEGLNLSDFPHPKKFRDTIKAFDIWKFPKTNSKTWTKFDTIFKKRIPELMALLPSHIASTEEGKEVVSNPFAIESTKDAAVSGAQSWAVNATEKAKSDVQFYELKILGGKASGTQVMNVMMKSGLQRDTLQRIWDISDIDRDGKMDNEEFALCMYLIGMVKNGLSLPPSLPMRLVPPGKRCLLEFE